MLLSARLLLAVAALGCSPSTGGPSVVEGWSLSSFLGYDETVDVPSSNARKMTAGAAGGMTRNLLGAASSAAAKAATAATKAAPGADKEQPAAMLYGTETLSEAEINGELPEGDGYDVDVGEYDNGFGGAGGMVGVGVADVGKGADMSAVSVDSSGTMEEGGNEDGMDDVLGDDAGNDAGEDMDDDKGSKSSSENESSEGEEEENRKTRPPPIRPADEKDEEDDELNVLSGGGNVTISTSNGTTTTVVVDSTQEYVEIEEGVYEVYDPIAQEMAEMQAQVQAMEYEEEMYNEFDMDGVADYMEALEEEAELADPNLANDGPVDPDTAPHTDDDINDHLPTQDEESDAPHLPTDATPSEIESGTESQSTIDIMLEQTIVPEEYPEQDDIIINEIVNLEPATGIEGGGEGGDSAVNVDASQSDAAVVPTPPDEPDLSLGELKEGKNATIEDVVVENAIVEAEIMKTAKEEEIEKEEESTENLGHSIKDDITGDDTGSKGNEEGEGEEGNMKKVVADGKPEILVDAEAAAAAAPKFNTTDAVITTNTAPVIKESTKPESPGQSDKGDNNGQEEEKNDESNPITTGDGDKSTSDPDGTDDATEETTTETEEAEIISTIIATSTDALDDIVAVQDIDIYEIETEEIYEIETEDAANKDTNNNEQQEGYWDHGTMLNDQRGQPPPEAIQDLFEAQGTPVFNQYDVVSEYTAEFDHFDESELATEAWEEPLFEDGAEGAGPEEEEEVDAMGRARRI